MAKACGILMIVGLIWIGLEVFTEGTRGAFGGIFAELGVVDDDDRTPPQRAGAALKRAHEKRGERYDRVFDQAN